MTPEYIEQSVSVVLNIPVSEIRRETRKREIVFARQMCMFLIYRKCKLSQEATGSRYNRDHATVIHSIKTINNLIEFDKSTRDVYDKIKEMLDDFKDVSGITPYDVNLIDMCLKEPIKYINDESII